MERDKPPPYVQYLPGDGTATLVEAESEASPSSMNTTCHCRDRQKRLLKIVVPLCLVALVIVLTSFILLQDKLSPSTAHVNSRELPEVENLALLSSTENSITFTWERPQARFDYYWVSISDDNEENNEKEHHIGSCSNGTIIHASQTRVTCTNIDACTNVSFTLRTHSNGPPERTSTGATIRGILIAGKDPEAPKNVTAVGISPLLTRLQWVPSPGDINTSDTAYEVQVCNNFTSCYTDEVLNGCTKKEASDTWLEFESIMGTRYCTVIAAIEQCGPHVLRSSKAMSVITAPLFDLPDVDNLQLVSVTENSITVTWERPLVRFDYYWISLREGNGETNARNKQHRIGSCSNGTIIHASQTHVTCTNVDACTNVSLTVRTHITGPPERTSMGATVNGIVIAGQDPDSPRNVTALGISPFLTRLQWSSSEANITRRDSAYVVNLCHDFTSCDMNDSMDNCTEKKTPDAWLEFQSTINTKYCVSVMAIQQCGPHELTSPKAVSIIRTPLFSPPDVTGLRFVDAGEDFFSVKWTRPEASFDYYRVVVIKLLAPSFIAEDLKNSTQQPKKPAGAGSCANGTIIHPDQTELTCTGLTPKSSFIFRLHTHIIGPPERTSYGVKLYIRTTENELPEVSNLKVENITATSFAVTWERPKECVEYYSVEVTDDGSGMNGDKFHSVVSCDNGAAINPRQTKLTCTKSDTCTSISVEVKTHTRGPPERGSSGAKLENVLLPGAGLPEVTNLKLAAVKNDSLTVTFQAPKDCVDGFYYNITDHISSHLKLNDKGCFPKRSFISVNNILITCLGIEACGKVDIAVGTRKDGPPKLYSPGVSLRGIFVRGKCDL